MYYTIQMALFKFWHFISPNFLVRYCANNIFVCFRDYNCNYINQANFQLTSVLFKTVKQSLIQMHIIEEVADNLDLKESITNELIRRKINIHKDIIKGKLLWYRHTK